MTETSQGRADALITTFKEMGFQNLTAFCEILKKNPTINERDAVNCWVGRECSEQLFRKIDIILDILKEGEHPLEYIVDGELFVVDHAFENLDYKGRRKTMYSKKVGGSSYTAPSLETLKGMVENHTEFNHKLTGRQVGYGKGKNMGD
jgi:hypothetical protein